MTLNSIGASTQSTPASPPSASFDVARVRRDFPVLARKINGKPLVYFDNAATSQKPLCVIQAIEEYYSHYNANIHRGVHQLSELSTFAYEQAREKVQQWINARSHREIVFTRGATEAINLIAQAHARKVLKPGDQVLITALEHHSNIVPWQVACQQTGAKLVVAPVSDKGELLLEQFERLLTHRTRLAAFAHVSNALGTINPVHRMISLARQHGALTLVDGAQAMAHCRPDIQDLGCDFYVFSGHKMFGPTGVGALYGREALLEAMDPWQTGGDMIRSVSFDSTTWNELPYKFEAGTPNIAGGIGLGRAIDYLSTLNWDQLERHERDLLDYGTQALQQVPGLQLVGTAPHKAAVLSFVVEGVHPHDVGTILDREGVAIRTGNHCAQPLLERLGVPATARASLAMYNTRAEIDRLVQALHRVLEVFR